MVAKVELITKVSLITKGTSDLITKFMNGKLPINN